jgi:hypothetical protein
MEKRSVVRARIGLLPSPLRRAVLAFFGPALDLPDDAKIWPLLREMLKQLHLFSPVHAVLFAALGPLIARTIPLSATCEPRMVHLARLILLTLYEVTGVPLLTLASGLAVRRYFRDPYTRHAATIALVMMMLTFVAINASALASFLKMDPRMSAFAVSVVRCAFGAPAP